MNIIRIRQEERKIKIEAITESIHIARLKDKKVDKKSIILAAMSNLNVSKRTASEYVDVAFFNLGL